MLINILILFDGISYPMMSSELEFFPMSSVRICLKNELELNKKYAINPTGSMADKEYTGFSATATNPTHFLSKHAIYS